MTEAPSENKYAKELAFWQGQYERMLQTRDERAAWLTTEALFIQGLVARATRQPVAPDARVLEIGAGPCSVIDFWKGGQKFAIDPLAARYKEEFSEFQDPAVQYAEGVGERLPYPDDHFDVVITRNALDHVSDAPRVLRETFRVLKPTGAFYVWIYLYSLRGSCWHRGVNALTKRYETEPWAFTAGRIQRFLRKAGLRPYMPLREERPAPKKAMASASARLKHLGKWVLGLNYHKGFVCVSLPEKGIRRPWTGE